MERPKMGFGIPIESWLKNELQDLLRENLSEANLRKHNLFNNSAVQSLLTDFFEGRTESHVKLWYLLMFQMWYNRWVA
jgi:asparagine synthase (glutamine-hydrolysing)